MPASVSVVIPAWCWDADTVELLSGAIDNIRETAPEAELVVIYAGITAGESLRHHVDVWRTVNPPQGWAAASNIGLLLASGDYLAVGSVDIRLPDGWLSEMLTAAGENGIASPLDFKGKRRRAWDSTERGSFWGAFFLFPRSILRTIGFLDGYTMRRYADMDWAIRARKAGFRTSRAPVRAQHVAPHHTMKAHPDPHDLVVVAAFRERHEGHDRLGTWEGATRKLV